jgi:hypothetical protein
MQTSFRITAVALVASAGLPIAGYLYRQDPGARCSLDGEEITPLFRVRIVDRAGHSHPFCCLRCAELWQQGQAARPRAVYVTDEISGREMAAHAAYFVHSRVAVPAATVNRIHAFAKRSDAEHHAATHGGRLLEATEAPFYEPP